MVFGGIQKVTLLDYPGKTACTVFTIGCDFACPFCQNASLINVNKKNEIQTLKEDDVLNFLKTRSGLLDGVCISGGEPLLQEGLELFIDKVKELGFLVKIDTNGSNTEKLLALIESGNIDYVAMDIKNSPEKYAQTIGLPWYDITLIDESISILLSDKVPYEFRTTVVKEFHTPEDLNLIAQWISGADKYYLQMFIDSDNVKQKGFNSYSGAEMKQFVREIKKVLPSTELRGV